MKNKNIEVVDIKEVLNNIELLESCYIYCDQFEELRKDEQYRLYSYCKMHAYNAICRDNLDTMRFAVSKIYFGF